MSKSKVNLLGKGFVGSRYCELTPDVIVNDRNDYEVKTDKVLYTISTIDNYNVYENPYLDIDTNLTTLIKTLESCKDKNVTFNFISSWFVYGNVPLPAREDADCDPKGFYSITKRAAEQLLISYCQTFGLKYRILRLSNILGESDSKVSPKKNAVQYMINELLNDRPVRLYDGGVAFRDYMYVDDAVRAINLVMNNSKPNQIYNIGNGVPVKLKDIIDYVVTKTGSKSQVTNVAPANFHNIVQTTNMVLDVEKLEMLGYKPKYQINDALDKLISAK
jgi:nucleoside-diphosphate-sugar epimerase